MASSSKSRGPYDVFLSFRGTDVRNNFVGHLYNALVQIGIRTFRDSEELWKGDNISMLMDAIEESHIAVIVFSENYASSRWCLEEVAKIMECNEQKVLTVRPVFYKVDPREVRNGRASYAEGLAKHESEHGKDSKEMERWKKALWDAGNLVGWTLNDRDDESKIIQEIVKDMSTRLSPTPLDVAEHPVGIESRVAKVKSILNLESKDDVLMVGLWGQGGIGKTTLARAIFNDISKSFDRSSFLANVREKSKDCEGLVKLQEQLLKDTLLLPEEVPDVARGKSLIPLRLYHKRVLLVLDDVDDEDQLSHMIAKKKNKRIIMSKAKEDDESKLIQKIVKEISTHLGQTPLHVAEHPVGIESRVAKVKSMLNLKSKEDVLMVGLWGQGGIGKTTLGKAIYNNIFRQFEGSSFLADVRENSKDRNGLVTLQERLLKDILLLPEKLEVSDVARGKSLIPERLCRKRVLVILDDVDDDEQLFALAGKANWFGKGSRILVITRDSHFLTPKSGWDYVGVYDVKVLDDRKACELFSKHAFLTYQELESRIELVNGFLNYAQGLPLALTMLGSLLRGKTKAVWESKLRVLSMTPNKGINNVLKVSYDGLEENEQEIFLHIACFFKGQDVKYTKKILDSCDFQATTGFDTLIERSLIRIEYGRLHMHDLIQAMGMGIVEEECRDDPAKRSRLWSYDDVVDVVSRDMGDCAVKSIVLDLPEPRDIHIRHDAFTKMGRLRLLILRNVRDSFRGPIYLPNELRWFEWPGSANQIPVFLGPKNLAGLDMGEGNVTRVVKQFKEFRHLKFVNFRGCDSLVRMPDISCAPNLESLNLSSCINLVEVHESITNHDNLRHLLLGFCLELRNLPRELKSKNLRTLSLSFCIKLERFPDIPHKLEGLIRLSLNGTAIKQLPVSIENLVSLDSIILTGCEKLVALPSSIYKLQNLREMGLAGCPNLVGFPKHEDSLDPSMKTGLSNLQRLYLGESNLCKINVLENLPLFPPWLLLHLGKGSMPYLPASSLNERDILNLLDAAKPECHRSQEIPELPPPTPLSASRPSSTFQLTPRWKKFVFWKGLPENLWRWRRASGGDRQPLLSSSMETDRRSFG